MLKSLCFLLIIFSSIFSQAKERILLISDIDDTIKVSHVISYKSWSPSVLFRAWDTNTPFAGMAALYQLIINENSEENKIAYLSNAPSKETGVEYLQKSHEKFLKSNEFPKGDLILRHVIFDSDHKNKSIRSLVAKYRPTLVIMIGDNGEKDVDVYKRAELELTQQKIKTLTYIHQLYSTRDNYETGRYVLSQQEGYVTPIEIALDLNKKSILSEAQSNWYFENYIPYILSVRDNLIDAFSAISFPSFKRCDDFKWVWPTTSHRFLSHYVSYINSTCR